MCICVYMCVCVCHPLACQAGGLLVVVLVFVAPQLGPVYTHHTEGPALLMVPVCVWCWSAGTPTSLPQRASFSLPSSAL